MRTDEELANELRELMTGDNEIDHGRADDFLKELLKELGYIELVKEYEKQEENFWYA